MKFRAPVGTTRIFCAGLEIEVGPSGGFDAPESQQRELLAHGCRSFVTPAPGETHDATHMAAKSAESRARKIRNRITKGL